MKLWLDDLREGPFGWIWAKDADTAIAILRDGTFNKEMEVEVISMDHDLADAHYRQEEPLTKEQMESCGNEKTGYDVICWMEENDVWPERVIIHSMNPEGARRMAGVASRHTRTIICPYAGKEI